MTKLIKPIKSLALFGSVRLNSALFGSVWFYLVLAHRTEERPEKVRPISLDSSELAPVPNEATFKIRESSHSLFEGHFTLGLCFANSKLFLSLETFKMRERDIALGLSRKKRHTFSAHQTFSKHFSSHKQH